jgi:NADPH:quinone reductase-like Zn-dependent oxidoreductase
MASSAKMPAGTRYDEAVAVPYGGVTALRFLRDVGRVQPGESVLILGAAGGVGRFAVQIAKRLGAAVTAVCSRADHDLVRALGADHVLDRDEEWSAQRYDVIFDCADATRFGRCRSSLTERGRYLTLYLSLDVLVATLLTALVGGKQARVAVAVPTRADLEELVEWLARGAIRPVIARRFPLEQIAAAHAAVGSRGSVIVVPR